MANLKGMKFNERLKLEEGSEWVGDIIDLDELKRQELNLIASGVGTGKTYFITHDLVEHAKDKLNINPNEILYVTSRRLIIDQQVENDGMVIYTKDNKAELNRYWRNELKKQKSIKDKDIVMMTYDKIINILMYRNSTQYKTLEKIKLIVFDEVHALLSDRFIEHMDALKLWIKSTLDNKQMYLLGLTATPKILKEESGWGVKINTLNYTVLNKYKAKELYCTTFESLPSFVLTNHLNGKTLVMCKSYKDCEWLKNKLPNSTILVSKHNEHYTDEMDKIRNFIIKNEMLPEKFIDSDGVEKELDILITTTTLREGVNLTEESNIKNVVCCFTDDIHIIQFCGRYRGNLEKIVVIDRFNKSNNLQSQNAYINKCRENYKKFMEDIKESRWFDSISHIVEDSIHDVKRFNFEQGVVSFLDYINSNWLVPKDYKGDTDKYKIWKIEDKQKIVDLAIGYKFMGKVHFSRVSFNMIMDSLENTYGYNIIGSRFIYKGDKSKKKRTYKLIVEISEDVYKSYKEKIPDWLKN